MDPLIGKLSTHIYKAYIVHRHSVDYHTHGPRHKHNNIMYTIHTYATNAHSKGRYTIQSLLHSHLNVLLNSPDNSVCYILTD